MPNRRGEHPDQAKPLSDSGIALPPQVMVERQIAGLPVSWRTYGVVGLDGAFTSALLLSHAARLCLLAPPRRGGCSLSACASRLPAGCLREGPVPRAPLVSGAAGFFLLDQASRLGRRLSRGCSESVSTGECRRKAGALRLGATDTSIADANGRIRAFLSRRSVMRTRTMSLSICCFPRFAQSGSAGWQRRCSASLCRRFLARQPMWWAARRSHPG